MIIQNSKVKNQKKGLYFEFLLFTFEFDLR